MSCVEAGRESTKLRGVGVTRGVTRLPDGREHPPDPVS